MSALKGERLDALAPLAEIFPRSSAHMRVAILAVLYRVLNADPADEASKGIFRLISDGAHFVLDHEQRLMDHMKSLFEIK